MTPEEELEARVDEVSGSIAAQGGKVRSLKDQVKAAKKAKESTADLDAEVAAAVEELKALKASLLDLEHQTEKVTGVPRNKEVFREAVNKALEGRLFYKQSFSIYGGVAGLYDYGPPGTSVKSNITQFWRQHFVFAESMLELECPAVTPEAVLRPSGHVERFVDFMVKDELGNCLRADHVLESRLEEIIADPKSSQEQKKAASADLVIVGEMDCDQLAVKLPEYNCVSPELNGGSLSAPFPFNLMFRTSIGPRGDTVGFLRPETAQGIFVSFRDLLYYNGGKLPFAAAQIGQSFRNEISPKQGLLRVREFTQAEIEHFVHPDHKDHPRFSEVAEMAPMMASAPGQQAGTPPVPMKLGDAVKQGIVANETLGYFIGRTYAFMVAVGINPKRMKFRQHLPNEMAHYACDCWDCEVDTSYGWIECAGLADRSAFDLTNHSIASKTELVAYEQFDKPKEVVVVVPQMKVLGKELKQACKSIKEFLTAMPEADALAMQAKLAEAGSAEISVDGATHTIRADMVTVERVFKAGRNFTPSVIEPSFGIGRILYCIFEHTFYTRSDDVQKTVFKFSPTVAPMKTTVFPLLQRKELNEVATSISLDLRRAGLSSIIDTTGITIGKRYARTDELGVPFAITVDYDTIQEGALQQTVTLRERDSMEQVRVPIKQLPAALRGLCDNHAAALTWADMRERYPIQAPPAEA